MGQEKIEESSIEVLTVVSRDATVKTVKRRQTFSELYNSFRHSDLSKLDSFFNALYICQTNKLCSSRIDVNNVGDGFFAHPKGWYKSSAERVRRATRTKTLKALDLMAKLFAGFSRSVEPVKSRNGFFCDNSTRTVLDAIGSFKKAIPVCAAVLCAVMLFSAAYIHTEKDTVIEFSVDGVKMGEVASAKTVNEALDRVNSKLSSIMGETFSFPYEISFSIKNTSRAKCLDLNSVYDILYDYTDDYITTGYGLYIDSELIAVLDNRDDITEVLETVKNEHMKLSGEQEDIANNIEIKYQEYSRESLISQEALFSMFSVEDVKEEKVATRSALLSVPTTLSTLSIEEPNQELGALMASNMIEKTDEAIVLDYKVVYKETVREVVPYEVKYSYDEKYYVGQEIVITSGRDGLANNTYDVKYINGVEAGRTLVEQEFIRKPRTAVIKVGTRSLPEKMSVEENGGKYMINPVPTGTVTSHYGWRILRGRSDYHYGFDIAAMTGTSIYAAASGEVIYAGYSASYGNHIKIRHADGLITLYGHCSKLLVELGDTVEQGDEIGRVGSTGNSTGSHCHLEVIDGDDRVDPEDYIYSIN